MSSVVIATRRPRNPIGWLLLAVGLGWALLSFATAYGDYALKLHPGALPAAEMVASHGPVGVGSPRSQSPASSCCWCTPTATFPARVGGGSCTCADSRWSRCVVIGVLKPGADEGRRVPRPRQSVRRPGARADASTRSTLVVLLIPAFNGRRGGQPGHAVFDAGTRSSGSRSSGWRRPEGSPGCSTPPALVLSALLVARRRPRPGVADVR